MDGHFSKDAHGRWVEVGRTLSRHSRTLEKIGHATVTRRSRSRFQIIRRTVRKKTKNECCIFNQHIRVLNSNGLMFLTHLKVFITHIRVERNGEIRLFYGNLRKITFYTGDKIT